ncbi:MAG: aminotransferase class I/II-fold pyridoxal phosphate-dependent enzyme [Chitinophagaceae bacterium]|nr:aminotransferase class I/II-fold pyridoxal phosphate-dependent enzyme [Chitinophagaceae bacterium]
MPNSPTLFQRLPVVTAQNTTIDQLSLKPVDPFHGYFKPNHAAPELDSIIQSRSAFRWFRNIQQMISKGEYSFQQTMSGKSGPEVFSNNRTMFMLSSYDYLGLVGHPYIEAATINAIKNFGTGTGGARMLAGTNQLHRQLEKKIATFKGKPAALACSSGYMANLAVISCIVQKKDRVIIDELTHRSLIDALYMAQVPFQKFKHNNAEHLKSFLEKPTDAEKTFIIIEGIYSMEGDICVLPEIVALKKAYNAYIILDESHSFGLLGKSGKGVDEHFGISPDDIDIYTSALSKSIPSGGGFIAASEQAIIYLQHAASAFVFSSAMSPMNTAAALAGVEILEKEGPERIRKLFENADYLRRNLKRLGYNVGVSESAIIPVIIGHTERTLQLSAKLYELGFLANPVIFPAIPPGGDRLRLCVTAAQSKYMLDEVIYAFSLCTEIALSKD